MSPYASPRPCASSLCPLFAVPGKARCQRHQREHVARDNANRDPGLTEFYNSSRWRTLRAAYRAANPHCETCATEGRETLAQQVDHRMPVREAPDLALEWSNLRSLCMSHHSSRTMTDRHHRGKKGERE